MNEIEFATKAIELLQAINEDNLPVTIELVNLLNDNYKYVEGKLGLHELIPLVDIVNKTGGEVNQSFLYALDNLQNMRNNEEIKWHLTVTRLIVKQDKNEIENFVLDFLHNYDANNVKNYQIGALIRLCVVIDNYNLLSEVHQIIAK